eukprot:164800-Alexandrium_andersonii.AAC.1
MTPHACCSSPVEDIAPRMAISKSEGARRRCIQMVLRRALPDNPLQLHIWRIRRRLVGWLVGWSVGCLFVCVCACVRVRVR